MWLMQEWHEEQGDFIYLYNLHLGLEIDVVEPGWFREDKELCHQGNLADHIQRED